MRYNSIIGRSVKVTVDRPLGSRHPDHSDMIYPVNYGYVEGIMAPDGEEQDVYILGVDVPVSSFEGKIIAVIHRLNDNEDKWVAAPEGCFFSSEEILDKVRFTEQYFESEVILMSEIDSNIGRSLIKLRYDILKNNSNESLSEISELKTLLNYADSGYAEIISHAVNEAEKLILTDRSEQAHDLIDTVHCLPEIALSDRKDMGSYWENYVLAYRNKWDHDLFEQYKNQILSL